VPDPSALDADPRYRDGVARFNRGDYFDAHEVWEDVWRESASDDARRFLQALIQIAAAYHHLQRGERLHRGSLRGASRLFHKALARLETPWSSEFRPPFAPGTLAADIIPDVRRIDAILASGQNVTAFPVTPPRIPAG
jgi:hypothetical protein